MAFGCIPASTAPLGCGTHAVEIRGRGGGEATSPGPGGPFAIRHGTPRFKQFNEVRWDRRRDEISQAQVTVATTACCEILSWVECIAHMLYIYRLVDRGGPTPEETLVWVGPITRIEFGFTTTTIYAQDMLWVSYKTALNAGYNYATTAPGTGPSDTGAQMHWDIWNKTFLPYNDPWNMVRSPTEPISVDDCVSWIDEGVTPIAEFTQSAYAYSTTRWEDFDKLAEDYGMDYTVVCKQIVMWDTHNIFCTLPPTNPPALPTVPLDLRYIGGFPDLVEYGNEFYNRVIRTNGTGLYGDATSTNATNIARYGYIELVSSSLSENDSIGPTTPNNNLTGQYDANLAKTAKRELDRVGNAIPKRVRMPSGTQVLPSAPWGINDMIPGAWILFDLSLYKDPTTGQPLLCRAIKEHHKLDEVSVTENQESGEVITITAQSAPSFNKAVVPY